MIRETNKRNSIYVQLLKLLIISSLAALAFFLLLDISGQCIVDRYMVNEEYMENRNQKYAKMLQDYIDREALSSDDRDRINSWIKKRRMLFIRIYKNEKQIFDSQYPDREISDEEIVMGEYEWRNKQSYYELNFSDGKAEVIIIGAYGYQFYNYFLICEIILSFALFLVFVLFGIRRKMDYIRKLSEELEILAGGGMDYNITIKGKDELSALATGLENMRISFKNLMLRETKMLRENQQIITGMSHDLRTPVTSIILYAEILKKGKYEDNEKMKEYLDKIDRKAHYLKQLTDHLFEYSLTVPDKTSHSLTQNRSAKLNLENQIEEEKVALEEAEQLEILFYDLFSETCSYLEQEGFRVKLDLSWQNVRVRISTDYVMRIMDNLASNILKYADRSVPVKISSIPGRNSLKKYNVENMVGFLFENGILMPNDKVESTGIGVRNIRSLIEKMGGRCDIKEEGGKFAIWLLFPVYEQEGEYEEGNKL